MKESPPLSNKLRGGYYTPARLAEWLCRWAIRADTDHVLEPSSGDGAFLEAAGKRLISLGLTPRVAIKQLAGVEIIADEVKKSRSRIKKVLGESPNGQFVCSDFFAWSKGIRRKFQCVVGNPPFIRYQNFPEPSRTVAMELMAGFGLQPNRLTNIWVPFVVGAAGLLAAGGRMALVLPAELLQVSYAAQLRKFLADHFSRIHIFTCNHLFFDDAEQEVVLLLADEYSPTATEHECLIEMVQAETVQNVLDSEPNHKPLGEYSVVNHTTEKWLKYFLTPVEIGFMRSLRDLKTITQLEEHADIDIGVVTGRNEFFVVGKDTVDKYKLDSWVVPLIGRSSQLRGAIIQKDEWQSFSDGGQLVHLLTMGAASSPALNRGAKKYIYLGESQGFHTGYKCSIRNPWYIVPSVWVSDCFFFRQIYDFPRVVVNDTGATSTDTIHRMRCKGDRALIATNIYTHLTAASAEIEGRSYGGGVLELEPTEAERVLMPKRLQDGLPIKEIDRLVRSGQIEDVLKENDRHVLQEIGLSRKDCNMLRQIWLKMRDRRMSRRRAK